MKETEKFYTIAGTVALLTVFYIVLKNNNSIIAAWIFLGFDCLALLKIIHFIFKRDLVDVILDYPKTEKLKGKNRKKK